MVELNEEAIREKIREAEDGLKELDQAIKKAERAGIDVAARRTEYQELAEKIRRAKAVYGG